MKDENFSLKKKKKIEYSMDFYQLFIGFCWEIFNILLETIKETCSFNFLYIHCNLNTTDLETCLSRFLKVQFAL